MQLLNPKVLFSVGLLVFFPFFVFLHGYYWVNYSQSLALAVYAMKVTFLPFLLISVIKVWPLLLRDKIVWWILAMIAPVFLISLVTPLVIGQWVGFYYFPDFVGLGMTVVSIAVFYVLLKSNTMTLRFFEKTYTWFLLIVSVYIIIYYYQSGATKLSIPLEMHIPIALVFGALLVPTSGGYRPPLWLFPVVAVACALSQLRENLIVFLIVLVICLFRGLFIKPLRKTTALFIVLSTVVFIGIPETRNLVLDRVATFSVDRQSGFNDTSINQRFEELNLVLLNMKKEPASLVFGKGFGAVYDNIDSVLQYYGHNVHNIHSTPLMLYFRNGVYGLFLFLLPGFAAGITLLSRDTFVFRASLVVVTLYAALIFNQYLYWNVQFGFSIALWLFSLTRQRVC